MFLQNPAAAAAKLTRVEWSVVDKLLSWPLDTRFPGKQVFFDRYHNDVALDLLRLTVLTSTVPLEAHPSGHEFVASVLSLSGIADTSAPDACVMLGLRIIANMFGMAAYQTVVLSNKSHVSRFFVRVSSYSVDPSRPEKVECW